MIINNSRLATYNSCPRKYYWSYVFMGGLVRTTYTEALSFGTIMHYLLALYYSERDWRSGLDDALLVAIPTFHELSDLERDRWKELLGWAERMMTEYVKWAAKHDKFSVLEVESEGQVALGSICYNCGRPYPDDGAPACAKCHAEIHYLAHKIDLTVQENGNVFPIDHKTTAGIGESYLASWQVSPQLYLYLKGVQKNHPSANRFQMNFLRKAKKVGQWVQKQCKACRNGSKKKLSCETCDGAGYVEVPAVDPPPFHRDAPVVFRPEILDRIEINRIAAANDIVASEAKSIDDDPLEVWPMRPEKCFDFGKCPFLDLCWSKGPADRWHHPAEDLLDAYVQRPKDYVTLAREEDV